MLSGLRGQKHHDLESDIDGGWAEGSFQSEFARAIAEADSRPMLVVTRDLSVKWHRSSCQHLLDLPLPLQLRDGKLVIQDELGPGRFEHFINNVDTEPGRFLVRGRQNPHWAMITAWRNPEVSPDVFVVCNLSRPHCEVAGSGMAEDIGLTKAETTVLAEFSMLLTPKEIAEQLGISLSTVRSHLKQIYAKASVQTGTQLLLLVHAYCSA